MKVILIGGVSAERVGAVLKQQADNLDLKTYSSLFSFIEEAQIHSVQVDRLLVFEDGLRDVSDLNQQLDQVVRFMGAQYPQTRVVFLARNQEILDACSSKFVGFTYLTLRLEKMSGNLVKDVALQPLDAVKSKYPAMVVSSDASEVLVAEGSAQQAPSSSSPAGNTGKKGLFSRGKQPKKAGPSPAVPLNQGQPSGFSAFTQAQGGSDTFGDTSSDNIDNGFGAQGTSEAAQPDGFGASDDGFGGFGSSDDGFSSSDVGFGSSDDSLGSSDGGFGASDGGFGSENSGFGGESTGFGSDNSSSGTESNGFGGESTGFGDESTGFGDEGNGFGGQTNSEEQPAAPLPRKEQKELEKKRKQEAKEQQRAAKEQQKAAKKGTAKQAPEPVPEQEDSSGWGDASDFGSEADWGDTEQQNVNPFAQAPEQNGFDSFESEPAQSQTAFNDTADAFEEVEPASVSSHGIMNSAADDFEEVEPPRVVRADANVSRQPMLSTEDDFEEISRPVNSGVVRAQNSGQTSDEEFFATAPTMRNQGQMGQNFGVDASNFGARNVGNNSLNQPYNPANYAKGGNNSGQNANLGGFNFAENSENFDAESGANFLSENFDPQPTEVQSNRALDRTRLHAGVQNDYDFKQVSRTAVTRQQPARPSAAVEEASRGSSASMMGMIDDSAYQAQFAPQPKVVEKIVEREVYIDSGGGTPAQKLLDIGKSVIVVVTGDRRSGVTCTALSLASTYAKRYATLLVDFDTEGCGGQLYQDIEVLAGEEENVQHGVLRAKNTTLLGNLVHHDNDEGYDYLFSMLGNPPATDDDIRSVAGALLMQRMYQLVVIDCPWAKLHALDELLVQAKVLICVDANISGCYNTVRLLDSLPAGSRIANSLERSGAYVARQGTPAQQLTANMAWINDTLNDDNDISWATLRVLGSADKKNLIEVMKKL